MRMVGAEMVGAKAVGAAPLCTRLSVLVGVVAVGTLMAGCSGAPPAGRDGTELVAVSIDGYADVTAVLDFEAGMARLPLDAIALRSPDLQALESHALWMLIDECMVPKGLPAVASTRDWKPEDGHENRIFGQWSVSLASSWGPGLPGVRKDSPGGETAGGKSAGGKSPIDTTLLGPGYEAELPSCFDEARDEFAVRTSRSATMDRPPGIDQQIEQAAYEATLSSEAGKAAVARRVHCLEDQGIVVDPESDAPSGEYYADDRTAITTAVAEATCNVETGAVQELFDLFARYQAAYMDRQEAQIVELAAQKEELVRRLNEIILGQ